MVLVVLLVVGLSAVRTPAQDAGLFDGAVAKLAGVAAIKGKKIGVGAFPMSGGRASEASTFVADQLDVALTRRAASAGYEVVTRAHLCQVIRENKLWVDDRFDPSLAAKLGRLGQADLLVAGQITPLGARATVSLRAVDTETGRQVWADSLSMPLDQGLKALVGRPVVDDGCGAAAPPPAPPPPPADGDSRPPLKIKVAFDKASYRIGDTVRIRVRVNRDAYLTLVDIGTDGAVTILYPNRFSSSHFVRGEQDVVIPPVGAGFALAVQGPPGFEQVRAIATEEPVELHASDFAGQTTVFRSLDRTQTRSLAVVIDGERAKASPTKWAEDVAAVQVSR